MVIVTSSKVCVSVCSAATCQAANPLSTWLALVLLLKSIFCAKEVADIVATKMAVTDAFIMCLSIVFYILAFNTKMVKAVE